MIPSSKRNYRTPPRLAERPAGALTFAEISSLPTFSGVSVSTLRNWLADGALGRLPASERGRGAAVYDPAYVAALVARGPPRARAQRAKKPRRRTRASVTKVGYGTDEGWATSTDLARRHGLPRGSSVIAAVARWNRAVTADRGAVESLDAALGPVCPELMAMLPLDARVRIVDGRRCRTYRAAHVALALAQRWKPSRWESWTRFPTREWALSCARSRVSTPLPERTFDELVKTIAREADDLLSAAPRANTGATPLSERMAAIVQRWCGADTAIETRLDEHYATLTAGRLHGEALRQWCKIASQRVPLTNRDELVVLKLIGAPRDAVYASGLAPRLARNAIVDLASEGSATRVGDWRLFSASLHPTESRKDCRRVLSLLESAEAARENPSPVRELGLKAITETVAASVAATTDAQRVALLRELASTPHLDRVVHLALPPAHDRFPQSATLAKHLTALAKLALQGNREHLLYAVVACVGGRLRSDRWLDAIALRAWSEAWTVPAWLALEVRDCILRGQAFSAEKAALGWIDQTKKKRPPGWSLVSAQLARVVLTDALAGAAPNALRARLGGDGALLREALRRRGVPAETNETRLAIALCIDVAIESAGSSQPNVCRAAMRTVEDLLRVADDPTRSSVLTALARSPELDPFTDGVIAILVSGAAPDTSALAALIALGDQARREQRDALVHEIIRAALVLADPPQLPAAWLGSTLRSLRRVSYMDASAWLAEVLSHPRLGTDWVVTVLREDPTLVEDRVRWVRRKLEALSTQIPGFERLLREARAVHLRKRREWEKGR